MKCLLNAAVRGLAAALALAPALVLGPAPSPAAETCSAESIGDAVDASAAELRAFSIETQPKLKQKLQALRDHKQWTDPDYEAKGLDLIHDQKLDDFDAKASELLTKIDTLGSPDSTDTTTNVDCANLDELKASAAELMAVMRAKSAYLITKVDREIASTPPAASSQTPVVAKADVPPAPAVAPDPPAAAAPPAVPAPHPAKAAETEKVESGKGLSPIRPDPPKADPPKPATVAQDKPPAEATPSASNTPPAGNRPPASETMKPDTGSSWNTTTAEAIIPPPATRPPPPNALPPAYDTPPPGQPYMLPPESGVTPEGGAEAGYSLDEIRDATRGFFGTVSTSLASVIEYTFQKAGRPTAYVLGKEGGGAFLAGLRYGEGTLYMRSGGSQKVFWHGPSIGSDFGADGSRTLFLIYHLDGADGIYRQFTGVDGTAYLVGGVGMTLLKGGPVLMAPIRSGLGLRIGASIGYLRFTSRPTWNPF